MHKRLRGFTLIELLVVMTTIVVLLSLVAAAVERAIYRAELAVCATRLHGTANGLTTYVMSFNRHYPYRQGVVNGDWEPHKLYQSLPNVTPVDERPVIKAYVPLESTLDPLCKKIYIDESATQPNDVVFRNSHQWAGFKWAGFPGMCKMGDRLTFTDSTFYPSPRTFEFSIVAADRDFLNFEEKIVDSSHPDDEGLLTAMSWQSQDVSGGFGVLADTALQATYSGWYRLGKTSRGKSDFNYAYEDGSVRRIDGVIYQGDERMTRVPHFANITGVPTVGSWPTQFDNLPKQ